LNLSICSKLYFFLKFVVMGITTVAIGITTVAMGRTTVVTGIDYYSSIAMSVDVVIMPVTTILV
jgi:hypothetical protein